MLSILYKITIKRLNMTNFRPGSNRDIVSKVLTKIPQTVNDIATSAGLSKSVVYSALTQLKPKGFAVTKKEGKGALKWARGSKTAPAPDNALHIDKVTQYLMTKVGATLTTKQIASDLKLTSNAYLACILNDAADNGTIRKSSTKPIIWTVLPPVLLDAPPQTLLPDVSAVMQASTAISTLMQSEQQKIIYQQTLQQILVVYEQLGNILEMAGLIEE